MLTLKVAITSKTRKEIIKELGSLINQLRLRKGAAVTSAETKNSQSGLCSSWEITAEKIA